MEPFLLTSSHYIEIFRNDGPEMISILGCDASVGSSKNAEQEW